MVKLHDVVASSGEVDTLVHSACKERYSNDCNEDAAYDERYLACAKEVELGVVEHVT